MKKTVCRSFVLTAAGVLLAGCAPSSTPEVSEGDGSQGGPSKGAVRQAAPAEVLYLPATDSCECRVITIPLQPKVHCGQGNGPDRVRWRVERSQHKKYKFEFVYEANNQNAPEKQGTGDWLGTVDPIECDGPPTTVSQSATGKPQNAKQWPYKIIVTDCDTEKVVCEQDPIIWIDP